MYGTVPWPTEPIQYWERKGHVGVPPRGLAEFAFHGVDEREIQERFDAQGGIAPAAWAPPIAIVLIQGNE